MMDFNEGRFRRQVDNALQRVRQILDRTRNPVHAEDVHHKYDDKFTLAELLVSTALACDSQTLAALGVTAEQLRVLVGWSKNRTVSLRLRAEEQCAFDKETKRDVDSAQRTETTAQIGGLEGMWSTKVVTTVTEYHWKFDGKYELVGFCGVGSGTEEQQVILSRSFSHEIVTATKVNPRNERKVYPTIDIDISWILRLIGTEDKGVHFKISRENSLCRTPRRNPDVDQAIERLRALQFWCSSVCSFFHSNVFSVWPGHGLDISGIRSDSIFVPVLPLFDDAKGGERYQTEVDLIGLFEGAEGQGGEAGAEAATSVQAVTAAAAEAQSVTLRSTDVNAFLGEQQRSLRERLDTLSRSFPASDTGKAISAAEVRILICLQHMQDVSQYLVDSLNYIEEMLRKQLISAIGKELTPLDFAAYTRYHNRKLFLPEFQPRPFCYAIRRSVQHSPEGHLSIEEKYADGSPSEPVYTVVRHAPAGSAHRMQFSLNAATTVTFGGDRYLHAWLMHSFNRQQASTAFLSAQARQFSSFIVLVGSISSATVFEPKYGAIIQNKDDLKIPLDLEQIPTPKEFRDAIESLSPEQQQFAKAFRGMQLESTLFGVCVIQIKPQLERLLKLPPESLTKEIKLTQDLTELFIKYQIPSDLLTCGAVGDEGDAAAGASAAGRVAEVKGHVKAMQELIAEAKAKELRESAQGAAYSVMNSVAYSAPQRCAAPEAKSYVRAERGMEMPVMEMACCAAPAPAMAMRRSAPVGGAAPWRSASVAAAKSAPPPPPPMCAPAPAAMCAVQLERNAPAPPPPALRPSPAAPSGKAGAQPAPAPAPASGKAAPAAASGDESALVDYTALPGELDRRFDAVDSDGAVRPTIIKAGREWAKQSTASLLAAKAGEARLGAEEQRAERQRAFDLLEALTRSGAVPLEAASLHVVLAATHGFGKSLVDTVVQDSANPIDAADRSSLLMASTVLGRPAADLVHADHHPRLRAHTPLLFPAPAVAAAAADDGPAVP